MNKTVNAAIFFLAAGIFTSVTILSAYQILFSIVLVYFSFLAIRDKKINLPPSAYWLLAFSLIAILSLVINFDLVPKPSKNFGRVKYFLFAIGGIFVLREWLKTATNKTKSFLCNTFLLSMVASASYAFWYYLSGQEGRVKALTDTMRYGYGSAMVLLLLLSAILHKDKIKEWFNPYFGITAFLFAASGVLLTETRGALLGFLCGLPFVLYFYSKKLGLIFGSLAMLGVLSLGGIYFFSTHKYESRLLSTQNNYSDTIRKSQWKAAVIAIKEKPILGWGLSNFHSQLNRIKIENDLDAKDYNDAHSHNLFLEIGSGTGIIGLLLFLGWLVSWARESFNSTPLIRALIVPFGVCFVISSQFEVTFDANNASMIFFLYSLSSALKKEEHV